MVLPDLACPRCGDQVDPLSLPRVPGSEDRPTVLVATVPERQAVQRENTRTAEIAKPPATEQAKVALPSIDNVVQWYADTKRLYEGLTDTEAELVLNLRSVRQMRQLLGTTLGLIEDPQGERDAAPAASTAPAPIREPDPMPTPREQPAAEPIPTGRLSLGPAHPDYAIALSRAATASDGRWTTRRAWTAGSPTARTWRRAGAVAATGRGSRRGGRNEARTASPRRRGGAAAGAAAAGRLRRGYDRARHRRPARRRRR
jgi:hypothetical protein